jgi:voltage-gated potassium channel
VTGFAAPDGIPSCACRNIWRILFLAVFTAGTTVFMLVEGWSVMDAVYMTTITLSTVGIQEVHPLSTGGRLATTALILGGTGSLAYELRARQRKPSG